MTVAPAVVSVTLAEKLTARVPSDSQVASGVATTSVTMGQSIPHWIVITWSTKHVESVAHSAWTVTVLPHRHSVFVEIGTSTIQKPAKVVPTSATLDAPDTSQTIDTRIRPH